MNLGGLKNFNGTIVKESSTQLVRIYEGAYTGTAAGKWNFATKGTFIGGVYASDSENKYFAGFVVDNVIGVEVIGSISAVGNIANDGKSATGTWTKGSSSGTWTGTRRI